MKMRISLFAALLAGSLIAPAGQAAELSWTGCGITKQAFIQELAAAYEKKTGTAVKISGGGATKGIRTVAAGTSDMGGSCRMWLHGVDGEIHPEEADSELVQVAWDAIVVVVHPDNPVDDIGLEQLKRIYNGEIENWSPLGGPDKPIALITRAGKSSGVGHMFRLIAFDDPDHEFNARSIEVKSTGPLEKRVEKMKTALAVDGISSAKKRDLKFLSLDGVAPTKENIASGAYPLFRPLYLALHKTKAPQAAHEFVAFALSDEGQALISAQGTVNLSEGEALNPKWDAKRTAWKRTGAPARLVAQ